MRILPQQYQIATVRFNDAEILLPLKSSDYPSYRQKNQRFSEIKRPPATLMVGGGKTCPCHPVIFTDAEAGKTVSAMTPGKRGAFRRTVCLQGIFQDVRTEKPS